MAPLADQIATFHTVVLQLSTLGLPIEIGKANSPKSLAALLTEYQSELEGRIARGVQDTPALLSKSSLEIPYCQSLEIWLREPTKPTAFQHLLGPSAINAQLRWQSRTAWVFPLALAAFGVTVSLITLRQIVPHLNELYLRSGNDPGPIFLRLQSIEQAIPTLLACISLVFFLALTWLWTANRTSQTPTMLPCSSKKRRGNHLTLAQSYALKAEVIRQMFAGQPDPNQGPSEDSKNDLFSTIDARDFPLQKAIMDEPFSLNERSLFQAPIAQLSDGSHPLMGSLSELYSTLSQFHQRRHTKQLQPWLLVLIGGSLTLLTALTLFLPFAEFMWLVSIPEGAAR